MKSVSLTHKGLVRETNQDSIVNLKDSRGDYFIGIADGMGGHKAGDVASAAAVKELSSYFRKCDKSLCVESREELTRKIKDINGKIYKMSLENEDYEGMGTTLTLCVTDGVKAVFYQVGDSRGYIIGSQGIRQITKDQSLVQFMVDTRQITPQQALEHPSRHVILSALGTDEEYDMDIYEEQLNPGDTILLCSDGLTDFVPDEDIERIVRSAGSVKRAAAALVNEANSNGGADNISVILFEA
ncbi:MAG: Stp1/IreP family PP2C-type Ser/Thr phosphatase [Eubacteriaceae bacterium]|nr:Stp1/IreP family PP2C-type Ser/Thr phosphatase [Eubacteriaceae bacterium]